MTPFPFPETKYKCPRCRKVLQGRDEYFYHDCKPVQGLTKRDFVLFGLAILIVLVELVILFSIGFALNGGLQ